jgi:CheY-like chemotaxis protein
MATVLVVDDDETIRRLISRLLEGSDFEIIGEAVDGESAVSAASESVPDVIVLDHMMPGMTGLEAAAVILAERPDQLIVLFTAHPDRPLFDRAHELGIAACITKTDVMTLRDVLATVVD